jgi:putative FmdB family regulatory protein
MPFYEYECSSCKYYTEVLQKLSDPVLKKCPSCGKSTFKKLVSAPVFRLKGSGWYETDFKGDKDSKRNLAGDDSRPPDGKDKDAKDKDGKENKDAAKKAEAAPAEAAKPAAEKPASTEKPAARSRRGAPAPRAKAPAKSAAKAVKKKSRR